LFFTLASTVSSGDPESDPLFLLKLFESPQEMAVTVPSNLGCGDFQTNPNPLVSQSVEYLYIVESTIYFGDLWTHPLRLNK
jgi:hypothetical protein